ncbi:hypothetical protein [Umezawaea sp. Da 62-37]|uniref:hypothetical protein n=1 Tax=Umezawaea sp. Da 62-37 TaxID=3075927 RepID=UPI0028F6F1A8|nr:hypothetical protein [Umezawaea sp. Da 62-37]WNV88483.1 hypothetical protein RM788_09350 [Umezawaea sp. Da 62-37]
MWEAIALHTTPETLHHVEPEVALVTVGVETDVLGHGLLDRMLVNEVVAAHPRPDFKRRILEAFADGVGGRPGTTFGDVKADVLEHFLPGLVRGNFTKAVRGADWSE